MQEQTILFVGDCAPYRENLLSSFCHVKDAFHQADLVFAQLESVLSESGDLSSCTRMGCSSRPEAAAAMKAAGIDVVSFASNHALDYGRGAFCETLQHLRQAGLLVTGAGENEEAARAFPIVTVGGVRIAMLGYCSILPQGFWAEEARPGCNPARGLTAYAPVEHDQPGTPCRIYTFPHPEDLAHMTRDIQKARQEADLVFVSMHWGIHFKEAEIADYQKYYAHFAIDAGADAIIGHHAHILKPVELYKGKPIFYSLGNFAMEEVTQMLRDQKAKGQDMKTSKSHREMTAISEGFRTTSRCFPMDCYLTMVVKCTLEGRRITQFSILPAYLPEDCAPYLCSPSDPHFEEVLRYMEKITKEAGLHTRYTRSQDGTFISMD